MKVTVKSWTAVASWRWMANDDNCGICRMPFDATCSECKLPGDDCPLGHYSRWFLDLNTLKSNVKTESKRKVCTYIVGPVFSLFPHALHPEVAELAAGKPAVPHVSTGVEVQGP
ncbi:uncharacterized protein LOC118432689 [Branchiostoma floridae]|uniref:Uncharacterized protein LOC118432689 n=1 Tax=Branchiostoma floridae TaxID=7739 RepID=A0A9J7MG02_BRAFL|nr:uncharacterized protein LOC118432689 [Branchiostoma floridae]